MENKQIVSLLAYNRPGVLQRITGLFARRGFNIESITAGVTQDERYSRITVMLSGDTSIAQQVIHQALKVVDVTTATILPEEDSISSELMLVKVRATPAERAAIFKIAVTYHATVVNVGQNSMTMQATAMPHELDELIHHLKKQGILELARTGMTALQCGDTCIFDAETD